VRGTAKRLLLETLGWLLVVAGVAALILPGPGLLMIFGGLVLLSREYEWARRRLEPVRLRALRGAADSVESWPRIVLSTLLAVLLLGCGVLWMIRPDPAPWWPVDESWWLVGGPWTGVTLELSGVLALVLLVYSYRRFHGRPEARAELEQEIQVADER
jgi:sterol desaturase/sphingolipid hydroxylase (fatty acid hydroxylase superfamily)